MIRAMLGYTLNDIGLGTDISIFQPDLDPTATSSLLDVDTDNDGLQNGEEDTKHNGRVDLGESNPSPSKSKPMPTIPFLLQSD